MLFKVIHGNIHLILAKVKLLNQNSHDYKGSVFIIRETIVLSINHLENISQFFHDTVSIDLMNSPRMKEDLSNIVTTMILLIDDCRKTVRSIHPEQLTSTIHSNSSK